MVATLSGDPRALSFWHDSLSPEALRPRAALRVGGDDAAEADVAIVGGGLTGLWTAHHLLEREPGLRIRVLEKEIAGFGASGRNGGWCSALFPASAAALERRHGREAAAGMRRAMIATVDEVGASAESLGIACDYAKAGTVVWARSPVQARAGRAEVEAARTFGTDELEFWEPGDPRLGAGVSRLDGAVFDPACARLHPAKLVRGLADSLERRGALIHEGTAVTGWEPGRVHTEHGAVRAERIVLATEAYTARFRATRRRILPLYSLMVATEPLPAAFFDEIGLPHGRTFSDGRHLLIYGQRTADDRIAFGGRGARYHLGSAIRPEYDRVARVFAHLREALRELFPAIGDPAITHTWGGPIGVPRDWHASVAFDPATGIAAAGGYVGDGLSTTHLAGRTLADLLTGADTELTRLPWVGHRSPDWEVEPLRFLGANAALVATTAADTEERITGRPSLLARLTAGLTGH
ncbi:MAG: FAD-dependent oxidoreductase [Actinomycetales bacterium]|nr:FAD-dependent oxidoreductase [Actinomycetales bacterium]